VANGTDRVAQTDFEKMLDRLPECGPMCEVTTHVDPLHGIEIQQMAGGNFLERPQFRSTVMLNTPGGPMPVPFEIEATTIHEAQRGWRTAAQNAVRAFDEKMRAAQRRIIVPGVAANHAPLRVS